MKTTYDVTLTPFVEGKKNITLLPEMKREELHTLLLEQTAVKTTFIVTEEDKTAFILKQVETKTEGSAVLTSSPILLGTANVNEQLKEAKIKHNTNFAILLSAENEEEVYLVATAQVKELGFVWSTLEYSVVPIKLIRFVLMAQESETEVDEKSKSLVIEDYDPRHLRERILACRAWLATGDAESIYSYYDILDEVTRTMDTLQTLVNDKDNNDSLEIFRARLRIKMTTLYGPQDFPTEIDRVKYRSELAT